MNTEEKFIPKGMLKMDLSVNPEGKTAIEVSVDGDFKSLMYLVSTLFKEEPRMYDLMKEAVEFHEFRNNMNDMNSILDATKNIGPGGLGEILKKVFK